MAYKFKPEVLVKACRLKEITGIGNAPALTIEEIYRARECWMLQQLREELPLGTLQLSELPVFSLHDALEHQERRRSQDR